MLAVVNNKLKRSLYNNNYRCWRKEKIMENQIQLPPRSGFVTVTAWIFIILAGFMVLSSLLQLVLISYVYPATHMQQAMQDTIHEQAQNLPMISRYITEHLRLFNVLFLILSVSMFIISIAVLKRKNWGRVTFVVLLAIGIIWELINLVSGISMFGHVPHVPANMPPEFKSMQSVMLIFSAILAAVLCVLFAWIIKRLLSAKIKAEFVD